MNLQVNFRKLSGRMKNLNAGDIAFYLFILLYLVYSFYLGAITDMSYDEPYSLYTSSRIADTIPLSYNYEFQSPGYFVILAVWRLFSEGIFFARLLSLAFTLLSAFFLYKFIRSFFPKLATRWIVVLFLLNPFTVYNGMEIRLYSLISLLAIVSVYLFFLIYFENRKNLKIPFILIATLGVYTQYFYVFLMVALAAVLLVEKEWKAFRNYILLSVIVAILFIPNVFYILKQMEIYPSTIAEYSVIDRIKSLVITSFDFYVLEKGFVSGRIGRWLARLTFLTLAAFTVYRIYQTGKKEHWNNDIRNLRMLALTTVFILVIFLTAFSLVNMVYAPRYLAVVFPFYILLLLAFGIFKPKVRNIIYGIYSLFVLISLWNTYKAPHLKAYNFKSLAAFTEKINFENEPILFVNNDLMLGLKHLVSNDKNFVAIPEYQYNYNVYTNFAKDTIELDSLINNVKTESKSFLVITGTDLGYLRNKDLTNDAMDSYFRNNYIIKEDTIFEGFRDVDFTRVRRIIKKN